MNATRTACALLLCTLVFSSTAAAGPPSVIGGKPMGSAHAHNVGVGWPSLSYEWWRQARGVDWALGAELVYGDWAGAFSDVRIGGAFNVPLRWHLHHRTRRHAQTDVALRFTPGALIGSAERRGPDRFVFGVRGELAVPVSVDVHERVNIVTGGAIPTTVAFVEGSDPFVVLPLLGRIGVEVKANERVSPWLLLELGPGIVFGSPNADVEFAVRVWIGTTIW